MGVGSIREARPRARDGADQKGSEGDGTIRIPNPPWRFSGAEVGFRSQAKYRGEDNRSVLADVLGYDDATIDGLEADGVLSSRVPSSAV